MSKYNQYPIQAMKSALLALQPTARQSPNINQARDILEDAILKAEESPRLPNGEYDERDEYPRELWTLAEIKTADAEAAQAHADASAALATNDRDGWDGAATRAEQMEERNYISMHSAFTGNY